MVRQKLEQRLHHEIALAHARVRQRKLVSLPHVHLIIDDVQIERARAIFDFARTSQAVLDCMQILQKFLRRHARARKYHGVHEGILVFVVRRLAFVVARDVDDLRIGNGTQARNGLFQVRDFALCFLAGVRHEGHVGAKAQNHIGTQVFERFHGFGHIMGAHHRSAQLTRH